MMPLIHLNQEGTGSPILTSYSVKYSPGLTPHAFPHVSNTDTCANIKKFSVEIFLSRNSFVLGHNKCPSHLPNLLFTEPLPQGGQVCLFSLPSKEVSQSILSPGIEAGVLFSQKSKSFILGCVNLPIFDKYCFTIPYVLSPIHLKED